MNYAQRTFCILVSIAMLAACGSTSPAPATSRLHVVGTVSPLTNIIYNIGGSRIELSGVVPEGVNSHTFEPAPADAARLAGADIIFINGLHLEESVLSLAQANLKPGAEIVTLGEQAVLPEQYIFDFSFPKEYGNPNPHVWMNPLYGLRYAEIVRDTLSRRDPINADDYRSNYEAFAKRIEVLDRAITQTISTIPSANRKLLTYHDSFAYFALRYEMSVIGAIQPADFAEPSAQDVAKLIMQIRAAHVPAVFGSEVFPSPVLAQIASETGAHYVDDLRDDDLPGQAGDAGHSYLNLLADDVRIMAQALGGDPSPIAGFDGANIPGPDMGIQY